MFFCGKKVCYLSVYEQKEKKRAAGFVKISGQGERAHFSIQIKNAGQKWNGSYLLWLLTDDQKISLGRLSLDKGNGIYEKSFQLSANGIKIGEIYFPIENIIGVLIEGEKDEEISGYWKEEKKEKIDRGKKVEQVEVDLLVSEELTEIKTAEKIPEDFAVDKWEQLLKKFKNVHPFGDERVFISIGPEDFVILRENYQKLVNNSFLLHGFYNYRHLILGKEKKIGNSYETCFYLGVPGVYFEREKMVAVMFGFEGFECAGPVEIGKFGYYLRQVEI